MQLVNVRVGSNDMDKSRLFYDATFGELGVPPTASPADAKTLMYRLPGGQSFGVGRPRDGEPATHANGGTIVLCADSAEQVAAWHAAGLANGGTCAGRPEPKPQAGGRFGAYLRDPDGNKLAAYDNLTFD